MHQAPSQRRMIIVRNELEMSRGWAGRVGGGS